MTAEVQLVSDWVQIIKKTNISSSELFPEPTRRLSSRGMTCIITGDEVMEVHKCELPYTL